MQTRIYVNLHVFVCLNSQIPGGSMTAALNAANERANELFRGEKLGYLGIPKAVEMVMESHKKDFMANPSLEDIVQVDTWARGAVDSVLNKVNSLYVINL
jgi:1-deoxy-D-xylulose-5-phosphate reductoisomerase